MSGSKEVAESAVNLKKKSLIINHVTQKSRRPWRTILYQTLLLHFITPLGEKSAEGPFALFRWTHVLVYLA